MKDFASVSPGERDWLVYLPGVSWDAVPGTDRRLAEGLAGHVDVTWIDPPTSVLRDRPSRFPVRWADVSSPTPGITRVRSFGPPGVTRRGSRAVAHGVQHLAFRSAHPRTGERGPLAVVLSDPDRRFPSWLSGTRILYMTDDWPAGAPLMGLPPGRVESTLLANLADADLALAVSPALADGLRRRQSGLEVGVLPNGCMPPEWFTNTVTAIEPTSGFSPPAVVGLVGQLNERLDLGLLEAVTAAGMPVRVLGPRADRDPVFGARLSRWLRSPLVDYRGLVHPSQLPTEMALLTVGLTPYVDNDFNRASFPLKTLEYLAAGLVVVSSDLPASRWLDSQDVLIAAEPADFAERVRAAAASRPDELDRSRRQALAGRHTWSARADELLGLARVNPGNQPR